MTIGQAGVRGERRRPPASVSDRDGAGRLRVRGDSSRRGCSRPCMPTNRSPGCTSVRAQGHAGDLDAVERSAVLEPELRDQRGEGRANGCSGRRTGGIRAVTCILFLTRSCRRTRCAGVAVDGATRKVLSTWLMIFLKAGAAAADVFIISGLAKVTTTTYCGSSAGAMPATETMRSLAVAAPFVRRPRRCRSSPRPGSRGSSDARRSSAPGDDALHHVHARSRPPPRETTRDGRRLRAARRPCRPAWCSPRPA